MFKNGLTLPAALLVLLLTTPIAQQQIFIHTNANAALSISVEAGLGSYVRTQHWTVLHITLSSRERPFSGNVEVRNTARTVEELYTQAVEIGAGASRRISLAIPGDSDSFEVVVRDAVGVVVASVTPNVRRLTDGERLIVSVSDPPDALNALGALRTAFGNAVVAAIGLTDLPERGPELDAADVLVFRAVDTSELSLEQVRAIRSWVHTGGHLLLVGGPSAALTHAGLAALAPATPSTPVFFSAQPLAAFASPTSLDPIPLGPTESIPGIVLTRLHADAEVLASTPETPLIVRRRLGLGSVDMLAFDPALAPLRSWPGTLSALRALLGGYPHYTSFDVRITTETAQSTATNLPAAAIPSPLIVLAWIILYTITLGPLNLFLLRRIRRLHLAWVTMPIITAAFGIGALLSGVQLNGNVPIAQRLTLRIGQAGEPNPREISLIGVWSQGASLHTVTAGRALMREISPERALDEAATDRITIEQNAVGSASMLQLGARTRALAARGDGDSLSDVVAAASYNPATPATPATNAVNTEARLLATITNRSAAALEDCTLLVGRNYRAIGDILPGQTIEAATPLRTAHPQVRFSAQDGASLRTPNFAGRHYGSAFDVSPTENSAVADEPAPFDLNGPPLTDALVDWANYGEDRQRKEARDGLIAALLDRDQTMPGATLGCWSNSPPSGPSIPTATTTDQTLSLWSLSLRPHLIDIPQTIPADLYEVDLVDSSDAATIERSGLVLAPGDHLLRLQPWLPQRSAQTVRASLSLDLRLTPEERTDIAPGASVAAWNWRLGRFEEIAPGIESLKTLPALDDDFVAADGGIRLRISVRGGRVTVVRAAPALTYAARQ